MAWAYWRTGSNAGACRLAEAVEADDIQAEIGVENPVLGFLTVVDRNCTEGLNANKLLCTTLLCWSKWGAHRRRKTISTRGTRTSSECAMLAQSVSRSS